MLLNGIWCKIKIFVYSIFYGNFLMFDFGKLNSIIGLIDYACGFLVFFKRDFRFAVNASLFNCL